MKQLNVLLIGDICEDVYYLGSVNRLSPEAPVPILDIKSHVKLQGMAANVLRNLHGLAAEVHMITGNEMSVKTRFFDEKTGNQLLRVDEDKISKPIDVSNILDNEYDCVVISDYVKGSLTYENIRSIINKFKHLPIFIDTKKTNIGEFDQIYPETKVFVKINMPESKKVTSYHRNLIVTDGKNGASYKGTKYHTPPVSVADACGAGDTFLAALAVFYCKTEDIETAINKANIAASITVQHLGVYAPTLEVIDNASVG